MNDVLEIIREKLAAFDALQLKADREFGRPSVRARKRIKRDRRYLIWQVIQEALRNSEITEQEASALWGDRPEPKPAYYPAPWTMSDVLK